MSDYSSSMWRWPAIMVIAILLCPLAVLPSNSQLRAKLAAHDGDEDSHRKSLSREALLREIWTRHEVNLRRREQAPDLNRPAATFSNIDLNDVAVIVGDNSLITPATPFDLNQQGVQFVPSGSGYTVSPSFAPFETTLGEKLDLTTTPAVNPIPSATTGDDAYILQDLGFNFNFFGTSYASLAVSSNGNLTFRPSGFNQNDFNIGATSPIETLTEFQRGLPRIAPYWHDLVATASVATGGNGVFIRRDSDRVLITWNNIRDFPNDPLVDQGVQRFQVSLFNDGRIVFTYDSIQLTSQALVGISPGQAVASATSIDLSAPPASVVGGPAVQFFSTITVVDYLAVIQAFYATHPGRDVYDFIYLMTDFDFSLGSAFAFYLPIRNEVGGIGYDQFDGDPGGILGGRKIQGFLNLSNVVGDYPAFPTSRFLVANHALSIMGQEQGHRWLAFPKFPGDPLLLLGRDDAHWSFFLNIESTLSSPAARRSSSAEGNVWQDNGNGFFVSTSLIDGYSRLDQYLMGLRPASDVADTFVIANPFNTTRTRSSNPRPNATTNGTRQNVSINQILTANGPRIPDVSTSPKNFRAAVVLLMQPGTQPTAETLTKVTRYRMAWESYFAQSTDYLATINTGLADQTASRVIAAVSAANYKPALAPGEIGALFGVELTDGRTESAVSQPLPTSLAGVEVLIDGAPAPLFYASPAQINFQVPRGTTSTTSTAEIAAPSATALVEVFRNGQLVRAGTFQVAPVIPALFTANASGSGPMAAVDAFTGEPAPFNARQANGQPNFVSVFGTGLGADGTDTDGNLSSSVQATIDGTPVTIDYAGRAGGFTGLNQLNIVFPPDLTPGTHSLLVFRNGFQSNLVTFTVR